MPIARVNRDRVAIKDFNWLNRKELKKINKKIARREETQYFYTFSTLSFFPVLMPTPLCLHSVLPPAAGTCWCNARLVLPLVQNR